MENKEKWREIFTEDQLKRLQHLEFKELLAVKKVCNQLNIQFFLYGGTLLGAYKYGGFIPWDDDVDVAMERDSYEKFVNEAPNLLPKDYVIQNLRYNPKSPYSYTKLRLRGTRCIENHNHELDIEQGIYIDIYPVDKIPDDNIIYQSHYKNIQKILITIYNRQCFRGSLKELSLFRYLRRKLYFFLLNMIPIRILNWKLMKEMTKFNDTDCRRMNCWYYPKSDNYYDPLFPLKPISFQGEEFYAPYDTEAHLRRRYGNIDELPPAEKRIGHYIHILDFGKFLNKDPR